MKKYLMVLLVCICCLTLIACGESSDHAGEARTPSDSSAMEGRNYIEVVEEFEEEGFTNIKLEKIEDLIFGWLTEDGEVEDVSVGGDVEYSSDQWVPADTEVIIRYHTFPEKDTEVDQSDMNQSEEMKTDDVDVQEEVSVKEEPEATDDITESVQAEELSPVEETAPTYTYTDENKTMYASQAVNVRSLPSVEGEKVGGLSLAQEVAVTGQCNETSWYRIIYNGSEAYVSNSYLVSDKPVIETTPSVQGAPEQGNASTSGGGNNSSSGGSSEPSVTVPSQEETVGNLVWVPTKGGKKYHNNSGCSNMENPMQVSIETAQANGYTACKRCH